MKVPFQALSLQHRTLHGELLDAISSVLSSGNFILGESVESFEEKFASYHGTRFAVGVNSGTDAIILSLKALGIGPGDEVITTGNTFITTVSSIELLGATAVLVDVGEDDNIDPDLVAQSITPRTKAILPVHWTGRPCQMDQLLQIAEKAQIPIVEDCAQAIGAQFRGKLIGTFGKCAAFSLHPFKTLGACGDAGIILTNDPFLYEKLRQLRHNGLTAQGVCYEWSNNSRLDALQAAILEVKMRYFETWTEERRKKAAYYDQELCDIPGIKIPTPSSSDIYSVYHVYIIKAQRRDELKAYLLSQGVETRMHYNVPIHKQPAWKRKVYLPHIEKNAAEILSLPLYPELTEEEQEYVISCLKTFYTHQHREVPCASLTPT